MKYWFCNIVSHRSLSKLPIKKPLNEKRDLDQYEDDYGFGGGMYGKRKW